MKPYKIEKAPPALTGNPQEDNKALADYMDYLREQMNFILTLIYKQMNA